MGHAVDETYAVYSETNRRARKEHQCDACDERIGPGVTYWYIATVFERRATAHKRCNRCQAIHVHLRGLCRYDEMWPDERLACGLKYEDEWGELPPEIEALAFALPGDSAKGRR
jgi:hypothetical protein